MIASPTNFLRRSAFGVVALLLLLSDRRVGAVDEPTSPTKPSTVATVGSQELTISATDQPGEIELTREGQRLVAASLPKNGRRITELRACKWAWASGSP